MLYKSKSCKILNTRLKRNASSGFTLAELLVAMAIIMILSAVTVVNLRTGSSEQALLRSAQTLAFNIRKAQNLALAPRTETGDPICFYGIKVNDNDTERKSYFLYYNNKRSGPGNCIGSIKYSQAQPGIKETIYLEKGVEFDPAQINNKDVAFIPPEPNVYMGGNQINSTDSVVLRLKNNTSVTRTVSVNKFGSVEIQ